MRIPLLIAALGLLVLANIAPAQDSARIDYKINIDSTSSTVRNGKRLVTVYFKIFGRDSNQVVTGVPKEEIVVTEDGQRVKGLEIFPPAAQNLTPILAIDISGSMQASDKIEQARQAALAFLDRLDPKADVGLVLFDHEIKVAEPPARDSAKLRAHRDKLRQIIREMRPQGGTAYIDATIKAVELLRGISGRKAVVLMTDGMDTNSTAKLPEAIESAQAGELPVYTIGIGQPGKGEKVTTVMVLDRSGSMLGKADDGDALRKIEALKEAATRFVQLMRPGASTLIQTFSTKVDPLEGDFTDEKRQLTNRIQSLTPSGGTALYDATGAGVETLKAKDLEGKRAVVVLTDGVDESPGSRLQPTAVIARAKEAKIPLYMLGLGRKNEINEPVMRKMAEETGGEYYHAGNQKKLLELFENLSIKLHDEGIDEVSLKKLAAETGGKYAHISDASTLTLFYQKLADELQQTYKVTYESPRSSYDGTARGIDIKIVRDGRVVSVAERSAGADYVVRGIVVPQMSYWVYLIFLGGLGLCLAFPAMAKKLFKPGAGQ